jgi:hypothetical protein
LNASVNPAPPAGYCIFGSQPYQWQAYVYYNNAWVAVGSPQTSDGPSTLLEVDCNDVAMHDGCTLHRSALIQVSITKVEPGPALLCAYKSGFDWYDDFVLNTPLGTLSLAPVASSTQDPANAGFCFPP